MACIYEVQFDAFKIVGMRERVIGERSTPPTNPLTEHIPRIAKLTYRGARSEWLSIPTKIPTRQTVAYAPSLKFF